MIKIGKSFIMRIEGNSRLCADIQIDEEIFTIYFMVDSTQEEYLCVGRADAFVLSVLPLAIREKHEIVCEELMSERLCYQLNEYLIPALLFEMGEEKHIRIKAPFTTEIYPNQRAVGALFKDDIASYYTIMKHSKECEYPLSHIAVFNSGVFHGTNFREDFVEQCSQAKEFARKNHLNTIFLDTNFNEVFRDKFQCVSSFRNLACVLALQGLFSMYLMSAEYEVAQFKLDLETAARYDLLTIQCVATESLSAHLFGSEVKKEKNLERFIYLHQTDDDSDGGEAVIEEQTKEETVKEAIYIGKPYITEANGRVNLCANVKLHGQNQTIWFSVNYMYGKYLVEDRADAFVVGLLTTAMRDGVNIVCEASVTRRLLYQINHYLIPTMAGNMSEYHYIKIYANPTDAVLECEGAVGTGWTGGVDSMFTYMRHFQPDAADYKLSHLLIANHGAIEGRTSETLHRMCEKTKTGFALEAGLEVIDVDTNLQEILPEAFSLIGPFRHASVVLAMQKLFSVFFVSSTYSFSEFAFQKCFYEMVTYYCFETNSTVFYDSGAAFSRIRKLKELSDFFISHKYLHPCTYALKKNCGRCNKCIMVESVLFCMGVLDSYSEVFDIEEYKWNKVWFFRKLLLGKNNVYFVEALKLLKKNKEYADYIKMLEGQMENLISVIIPLYNSESYIHGCIQSVQEQSYSNVEIIIVDDGSIDGSREICREMRKLDQRVLYFAQEHRGVSAARNTGISVANGEYLFFLDSDDMIHPDLLKNLFHLLKKTEAKMATEYYCQDEEVFRNMNSNRDDGFPSHRYSCLSNQRLLWEFLMYGQQGGIGGKMIRRSALGSRKFDENLIKGEDTKFIYQLIVDGVDAVILYKDWYYYRTNEGQTKKKDTINSWKSTYESMRYICDSEKENGRMENAVGCEEHIIKWLIEGSLVNQNKDDKIAEFLKRQLNAERKLGIFSQISRFVKFDAYLVCHCYPIYNWKQKLAEVCRKRKAEQNTGNEKGYSDEHWKKDKDYVEKITVIISGHNSESCVRRCIQSAINQSYSNLEIIVVDDGLSDESLKICKKIEASDKRVHVYNMDNRGISAARNYGLELATGKYVFFLNSNEVIHPLLLEELLWQAEDCHAGLTFCEYLDLNMTGMENVLEGISEKDERSQWEIIKGIESEKWIYKKYYESLMRVGILISGEAIGTTRFSETLLYGGEALFLYQVARQKKCIVYSVKEWYYRSISSAQGITEKIKNQRYFDFYRTLRDEEYQRGYYEFSLVWERRIAWTLRENYMLMTDQDSQSRRMIKDQALSEWKHPLFKKLPVIPKTLFLCCFFCNPLYKILKKPVDVLDKMVWAIGTRVKK